MNLILITNKMQGEKITLYDAFLANIRQLTPIELSLK